MTEAPQHTPFDGAASLYAIGALREADRLAFEKHLEVCQECVGETMSLLPLAQGLAQSVALREVPIDLRARVLKQVVGIAPAATAEASAAASQAPPVKPPSLRSIKRVIFRLAALVCLAAAGGLGWYAAKQVNLANDLQAKVRAASLRANIAEIDASGTRQALEDARSLAAILAAPDLLAVRLDGQPDAVSANGHAFWSPTRGVVLAATNLPSLPQGHTYQLWFVMPANAVSAGLLQADDAGRIFTTVERPVEDRLPVAVAITVEPDGGGETPSNEVYLLGRTPGGR
jgi:anti-sigma-K factor RskA